jgi:hypothetical protein
MNKFIVLETITAVAFAVMVVGGLTLLWGCV